MPSAGVASGSPVYESCVHEHVGRAGAGVLLYVEAEEDHQSPSVPEVIHSSSTESRDRAAPSEIGRV